LAYQYDCVLLYEGQKYKKFGFFLKGIKSLRLYLSYPERPEAGVALPDPK